MTDPRKLESAATEWKWLHCSAMGCESGRQDSNLRPLVPQTSPHFPMSAEFDLEWFCRELVGMTTSPCKLESAGIECTYLDNLPTTLLMDAAQTNLRRCSPALPCAMMRASSSWLRGHLEHRRPYAVNAQGAGSIEPVPEVLPSRFMDLASSPGVTSPSRAVWDLVMRASRAWSSQDPEGVASCYEENASLTINRGKPSTGRAELAATAAGYMEAFPDLRVSVDHVLVAGDWSLLGMDAHRIDYRAWRNRPPRPRERHRSLDNECVGSRSKVDWLLRRRHLQPPAHSRHRTVTDRFLGAKCSGQCA